MTQHPYWAYEAVPGSLTEDREKRALAEGRRAFALQCASQWDDTAEGTVATAKLYEAYLKGEAVEDVNGAPLVTQTFTEEGPHTTAELLRADETGAMLHVSGAPVWYRPRSGNDETPWARYGLVGAIVERYASAVVEVRRST